MMTIHDLLQQKGTRVHTIAQGETVAKAVGLLTKYHVGALIVTGEDSRPVGIVSERDILRFFDNNGAIVGKNLVEHIMTPESRMIVITPDDTVDYAMGIMTQNRIRHLPVIKNGALAGIVSIGDMIKSLLSATTRENKMLSDYIQGSYPA
ncbi:MAG: CBS domain-containing protein [Lentisphaeria bacterium]|nr:CBS domain-containing protein [Lentisphaeria bacterium]